MIYSTFLALGDSMTYGARGGYDHGYPEWLSDFYDVEFGQRLLTVNAGINGETTSQCRRRAKQVIESSKCNEMLFFEGTNDAKDTVQTPDYIYESNVRYIIDCALINGVKLYLGLIPDLRGFGAPDYSIHSQELMNGYNKIIRKLSKEYELPLVDFTGFHVRHYSDGVHFNTEGYRLMAAKVINAIKEYRKY